MTFDGGDSPNFTDLMQATQSSPLSLRFRIDDINTIEFIQGTNLIVTTPTAPSFTGVSGSTMTVVSLMPGAPVTESFPTINEGDLSFKLISVDWSTLAPYVTLLDGETLNPKYSVDTAQSLALLDIKG